jgi:nitric oxide reductase subunit C
MLILSILFAVYSGAVYCFADSNPVTGPLSPEVRAGWLVWQEKNCQSCHQLYGLGGYAGPDLTDVSSGKGADYMRSFITSGTERMPDFQLTASQVNQVIAFLSWVDQSGNAWVPDSAVRWTGSYKITAP